MEPRTTVYKNKATGIYYVQSYTIGPVAASWYGDPIVVRPEEFSSRIAMEVIKSLKSFGKEKFDPAKAKRFGPKEQSKFLDQHTEILISMSKTGDVVIHALRRDPRGRVGDPEGKVTLSERDLPDKLADAIAWAFQRAT